MVLLETLKTEQAKQKQLSSELESLTDELMIHSLGKFEYNS